MSQAWRRTRRFVTIVAVSIAVMSVSAITEVSAQVRYTITDLGDYLIRTSAAGVNSSGQVTGFTWLSPEPFSPHHAYLYDHGRMIDLSPNPWRSSQGKAVNDSGLVAGGGTSDVGPWHAFLFQGQTRTDLGTLGGWWSEATAINNSGQIAGTSHTGRPLPNGNQQYHAFLYDSGTMTDLGTLGGATSQAFGINAWGQVVGGAARADGSWHGFLSYNGTMTDLGTLGGVSSHANGIDLYAEVIGWSNTPGGSQHAFYYFDGEMDDMGTLPGGQTSQALAINNNGLVVGGATVPGGTSHAFVYDVWDERVPGMIDLNSLIPPGAGWTLWAATGVNDAGQIVGYGMGPQGPHGFLLTPVP